MTKTKDFADWNALCTLADLVRTGRPVPTDLQARANEAIARAVAAKELPRRPAGRPANKPGRVAMRQLRAALGVHALVAAGIPKSEAVSEVAEALKLDESSGYRYAKGAGRTAQELIESERAGVLDLLEPDEVVKAVEEARHRAMAHNFEDLTRGG